MRTYRQALAAPTKDGKGWAHADQECTAAVWSLGVSIRFCLNAAQVFSWVRRHYNLDWKQAESEVRSLPDDTAPFDMCEAIMDNVSLRTITSRNGATP